MDREIKLFQQKKFRFIPSLMQGECGLYADSTGNIRQEMTLMLQNV